MLRFLLFAVCLFVLMQPARAQDWRTVRVGDTAYFMGGNSQEYGCMNFPGSGGEGHVFRTLFTDSAGVEAGDSVFYLQRYFRQENNFSGCADTSSPSWLGKKCIRRSNADIYFNRFGDTISIRTMATLGDVWLLARDTGGRTFQATVTDIDTFRIDGVLDSVKTASIQAFSSAGVAVVHPHNARVLQWSKKRGWVKALDFYQFPHPLPPFSEQFHGTRVDTAQAVRLPSQAFSANFRKQDLAWKYAPGNEWIGAGISTANDAYTVTGRSWAHDSVMAFQWLSTTTALVTLQTTIYTWQANGGGPASVNLNTSVHTDVIGEPFSTIPQLPVPLLPEYRPRDAPFDTSPFTGGFDFVEEAYAVDTFCEARRFVVHYTHHTVNNWHLNNGCWDLGAGFGGPTASLSVLQGFGQIRSCKSFPSNGSFTVWGKSALVYAKLAGCIVGNKISVASLQIAESRESVITPVSLAPNPTSQNTRVIQIPRGIHTVTIRDASGLMHFSVQTNSTEVQLPTANLSTGLYFVEVSSLSSRTTLKLQVIH